MKGRWKSIAALLLVFALVLITPGWRAAEVVDLDKDCAITLDAGADQIKELTDANVVLDVYKVADAVAVEGYDTYDYALLTPYDAIELPSAQERDANSWSAFAQELAQIALNPENEPFEEGVSLSEMPITPLETGLYLVIARGADVEDYVSSAKAEDGKETIVTVAYNNQYEYGFSPMLVSLPTKDADEEGIINTGNAGEWLYEMPLVFKPDRTERKASLEIIKNLTSYVSGKPATFVFQVEGYLDGEHVLSDTVTIDIEEGVLRKSEIIKDIPVGTQVTVTEVYSGAVYQLVAGDTASKDATIVLEPMATVEFTNEPSGSNNNGGSITNEFVFNADANRWEWTPIRNR